jgi:CDP-diacylglycerol--glycerol-3-phosphate 3-phosphatidyltransferase
VERPALLLWFHITDMSLTAAVFSFLLYQQWGPEIPQMFLAGTIATYIRLIGYAGYSISLLRNNKLQCRNSFWSRISTLGLNINMIIWVLDFEHYQQIAMGISLLLMLASTVSYLYFYYRDPAHRHPLSVSNQLTVSRITLTPVFIWVFSYDSNLNFDDNHIIFQSLAIIMVMLFMLTDFLDGYLARKWGEVSTLGKYLDPFSDKISNMTIFLCFMVSGYADIWMVAMIYFREASVETLRTLAANQNIVMPARQSGKWKTAIQGMGIVVIMIFALQPLQTGLSNWQELRDYLPYSIMGLITGITILSGIDYFWTSRDILKKYV